MLPLGEIPLEVGAPAAGVVDVPAGYDGPIRWEINDEYPQGHAVPYTADELAQRDVDKVAAEAASRVPVPATLEERFHAIVDVVLEAPDFDTAKKQIAALKDVTGKEDADAA